MSMVSISLRPTEAFQLCSCSPRVTVEKNAKDCVVTFGFYLDSDVSGDYVSVV